MPVFPTEIDLLFGRGPVDWFERRSWLKHFKEVEEKCFLRHLNYCNFFIVQRIGRDFFGPGNKSLGIDCCVAHLCGWIEDWAFIGGDLEELLGTTASVDDTFCCRLKTTCI